MLNFHYVLYLHLIFFMNCYFETKRICICTFVVNYRSYHHCLC
uniref:Uncharacterized protein n=1 Tax=Rhizophora mucronata TaxID=61149 RepID=A0A2P2QUN0_RHIMU